MASAIVPAELIQVQDIDGTWHAAQVGPGILCRRAVDDYSTTLAWDTSTDLVDCPDCLGRLAPSRTHAGEGAPA